MDQQTPQTTNQVGNQPQTATYYPTRRKENTIGLIGFITSIVGFFLGWIPIIGWGIWAVGLILSIIGVFQKPRGFAIAGIIISVFEFIILFFLLGIILAIFGAAAAS